MGFKIWTISDILSNRNNVSLPLLLSVFFFFKSSDEHHKILHIQRKWIGKYTVYENADPQPILGGFAAKVKLFCCTFQEYSIDSVSWDIRLHTYTAAILRWDLGYTNQYIQGRNSSPESNTTGYASWLSNALNSETATYLQGKILTSDSIFFLVCL